MKIRSMFLELLLENRRMES